MLSKRINVAVAILTFALSICAQGKYSAKLEKEDVRKVVNSVTAWQIAAYPSMNKDRVWKSHGDLSWENGVFHSALATWAEFDKNPEFIDWYTNIANKNFWQLNGVKNRIYYADDLIVALMYAQLYNKSKEDKIIHPIMARLEFIVNNPPQSSLQMKTPNCFDRWSWADALYMAPPVFAAFANISGNNALRDFMDKEYWISYDYLYDKEEKLFFRDSNFFDKKEKNGKKVFWGRGNAWVVGGLAQIIPELPQNYPSREKYIVLFQEMMSKIVSLQDKKGHWHASLLDPESYPNPEMSSTGFFTYALFWGINNGILDEKVYLDPAKKGWSALVNAVHPNGMLGWVQPVGADPQKVTKNMTEVYGAGAFMLAGMEIIKYLK